MTKSAVQLIVPMAGFGERFRRAGYKYPKPLLQIGGMPMVAHVIRQFGEMVHSPVLICNEEHLADPVYAMRETLGALLPEPVIVPIAPHKLGPVHSLLEAESAIDDQLPVVVAYSDCVSVFDIEAFFSFVKNTGCDAAFLAYRGFHPHARRSAFHAYIQVDEQARLLDIQEKRPFTDSPMQEFASSGVHYFASGKLLKELCRKVCDQNLAVLEEFFVSMTAKPSVKADLDVRVFEIPFFMNWGTPEDYRDYSYWYSSFEMMAGLEGRQSKLPGLLVMPLAGKGERFTAAGRTTPKPLTDILGLPMVVRAAKSMMGEEGSIFVLREDIPSLSLLEGGLKENFPDSKLVLLPGVSEGQACSCYGAMGEVPDDTLFTIAPCDSLPCFPIERFLRLVNDIDCDIIVWVARGLPLVDLSPDSYSWAVAEADGRISVISEKHCSGNSQLDGVLTGAFTFRRKSDFIAIVNELIAQNRRVNNEFYVDSSINVAIEMGMTCKLMEVDALVNLGTPEDVDTFNYWSRCFSSWPAHSFSGAD